MEMEERKAKRGENQRINCAKSRVRHVIFAHAGVDHTCNQSPRALLRSFPRREVCLKPVTLVPYHHRLALGKPVFFAA